MPLRGDVERLSSLDGRMAVFPTFRLCCKRTTVGVQAPSIGVRGVGGAADASALSVHDIAFTHRRLLPC